MTLSGIEPREPDGHIVARNMWRLINILRINYAPSWLYLEDYTGMHGQQNIILKLILKKQEWGTRLDFFFFFGGGGLRAQASDGLL